MKIGLIGIFEGKESSVPCGGLPGNREVMSVIEIVASTLTDRP